MCIALQCKRFDNPLTNEGMRLNKRERERERERESPTMEEEEYVKKSLSTGSSKTGVQLAKWVMAECRWPVCYVAVDTGEPVSESDAQEKQRCSMPVLQITLVTSCGF